MVTKFEVLPNEILIQCFEYLNAPYLFHSFDQLNHRFNDLIRHIPLCINLKEDLGKSILDNFCIKMLLNSKIKDQVYSLNLPLSEDNDPAGRLRTNTFLSFFPLEDFTSLQKFRANAWVNFLSIGTASWEFNRVAMLDFSVVSFPELRALSLSRLHGRSKNLENISLSITNLTLDICDFNDFYWLSQHAPMLEHLHLCRLYSSNKLVNKQTNEPFPYLKKLIIDDFIYASFDDFEQLVRFTPNLRNLTISAIEMDLIDAGRWEQLITTSLPSLNTFQFKFSSSRYNVELDIMIPKLEEFQSDFWRKEHHWFTEYAIADDSICVYTIPYVSNKYELESNYERHHNNCTNNSSIFDNVTNLRLYCEILKKKCEDYFSNVKYLQLDGDSKSLTMKEIECLRKIINPFHLKHLDLSRIRGINSSLVLKLFEQMPQLSVLSVWRDDLIRYFNDTELCKRLNKMVKRLYVKGRGVDDLFKMDQFYEVFSNIEHLKFEDIRGEELLFSLSRLPKLSTLQAKWEIEGYPDRFITRIKKKFKRQNVIYEINAEESYTDEDYRCRKHRRSYWDSDFSCSSDECVYSHYSKSRMAKYDFKISMWRDNGMN